MVEPLRCNRQSDARSFSCRRALLRCKTASYIGLPSANIANELLHSLVMRSAPIDSTAGKTSHELFEAVANSRAEAVEHRGLVDLLQRSVASHTARKRSAAGVKIKGMKDLAQLQERFGLAQPVTMRYSAVLE